MPEEGLKVGKRATESVKHIRTYVVEEPVKGCAAPRRTVIEERPATGAATGQPIEREYEVRERHQEPQSRRMSELGRTRSAQGSDGTYRNRCRFGQEDQDRH
jgi:hypothetical protein